MIAPDVNRIEVNPTGSILPPPRARRHRTELEANATMVIAVVSAITGRDGTVVLEFKTGLTPDGLHCFAK